MKLSYQNLIKSFFHHSSNSNSQTQKSEKPSQNSGTGSNKAQNSASNSNAGSNSGNSSQQKVEPKQILKELMDTQLKMAKAYNYCATTCTNEAFRTDLLNIMKDNYSVYSKQYDEAKRRGWVNEVKATTENIDTVKAKYDQGTQ